jgi:hypothetical protein
MPDIELSNFDYFLSFKKTCLILVKCWKLNVHPYISVDVEKPNSSLTDYASSSDWLDRSVPTSQPCSDALSLLLLLFQCPALTTAEVAQRPLLSRLAEKTLSTENAPCSFFFLKQGDRK